MSEKTYTATDITVADLPERLRTVDSVEELRRMKSADKRVTAQEVYDTRIAEIEGTGEPVIAYARVNPAITSARVRVAGQTNRVAVTEGNRAEIEALRFRHGAAEFPLYIIEEV